MVAELVNAIITLLIGLIRVAIYAFFGYVVIRALWIIAKKLKALDYWLDKLRIRAKVSRELDVREARKRGFDIDEPEPMTRESTTFWENVDKKEKLIKKIEKPKKKK